MLTALEICKQEIGSIILKLDSQDMEKLSQEMEESEYALSAFESENLFRLISYENEIFFFCTNNREEEEKRKRRALKPVEDEGLEEEDDVSVGLRQETPSC